MKRWWENNMVRWGMDEHVPQCKKKVGLSSLMNGIIATPVGRRGTMAHFNAVCFKHTIIIQNTLLMFCSKETWDDHKEKDHNYFYKWFLKDSAKYWPTFLYCYDKCSISYGWNEQGTYHGLWLNLWCWAVWNIMV